MGLVFIRIVFIAFVSATCYLIRPFSLPATWDASLGVILGVGIVIFEWQLRRMSLKRLIGAGIGMGFLPHTNVRADEAAGLLKTMKVEGMRVQRELALVFRKDKTLTRAAHAFLEVATNGARAVPPVTRLKSKSA